MFEKEIEEYERVRANYQENIADRMSREQWMEYNEILFSAHSLSGTRIHCRRIYDGRHGCRRHCVW